MMMRASLAWVTSMVVLAAACGDEELEPGPEHEAGRGVDAGPGLVPAPSESAPRQPAPPAEELDAEPPAEEEEAPSSCPRLRVQVPAGSSLNVRESPNTTASITGKLPNFAVVEVLEQVDGEEVSGNPRWSRVAAPAGYVSMAFATCTTDEAPVLVAPSEFHLPLECDRSARISQGNNGNFSHTGFARYAFDFALPLNTPLVAIADGIVSHTFNDTKPGDPCYSGGGPSCRLFANYVVLRHGDGTYSNYRHLNSVLVTVGEFVRSGKPVGLSGGTGYSTGPHAHVARQVECNEVTSCQSLMTAFADVPGNGIPRQGQTVTSKNGCEE